MRFLVEGYGFTVAAQDPVTVRFESPTVFLVIFHGRSSMQVDFEIGQLLGGIPTPKIGYAGCEVRAATDFYDVGPPTCVTAEGVREAVGAIAAFLKTQESALRGDDAAFRLYERASKIGSDREMAKYAKRTEGPHNVWGRPNANGQRAL